MTIEGISLEEYQLMKAGMMTERTFQACVVKLAQSSGWLVYHTFDSRRSQPGYPDLHLVHAATGRSLFRELKTQKGKTSPAQDKWILALTAAGHDVAVWRPSDWFGSPVIETQLSLWVAP